MRPSGNIGHLVRQSVDLSAYDRRCLEGREGPAARFAMSMLEAIGNTVGADRLVSISQCHLVGSYYSGEADIRLLETLVGLGGYVRVPTTLNASSACMAHESPSPLAARCQAKRVVSLYERLGCDAALTCAPYQLPSLPAAGEKVAWAESNAVVYANSVLGARTNKTVQYVDLCAALTGRIPCHGLYLDEPRRATELVDCSSLRMTSVSEALRYELLGLYLGYACGSRVAVLAGLQDIPSNDSLRGLGSAAASSGDTSLFHVEGVTPEARTLDAALAAVGRPTAHKVLMSELSSLAAPFRGTAGDRITAICLGTPHYSLAQLRELAGLVGGQGQAFCVPVYVTTSRYNMQQLGDELLLATLVSAGVSVVTDACSYYGDVISGLNGRVMTDSVKWAFYGTGNLGVGVILGSLEDCLASARCGRVLRRGEFP